MPLKVCWELTGKAPIKVKWLDINKGDEEHENYRSRLVAMELKAHEWRDDVFAATPPLESLKFMLSIKVCLPDDDVMVVTDADDVVLALMDVSRAHFHSPSRRRAFVELCVEDSEPGMCAYSHRCMAPGMLHRTGKRSTQQWC